FCLRCLQVSPLGTGGLHPLHCLKKLPSRSCRSRTLGTSLSGIALPTELLRTLLQTCLIPKTCLSSPGIQWKFTEVNPRTCEPLAAISASATCSKGAFNRVATRFGDGSARRRKNRRPSLVQSLRSPGNRPVQSRERRHRENCSHPHRLRRRRCGGRAFNHQAQAAH